VFRAPQITAVFLYEYQMDSHDLKTPSVTEKPNREHAKKTDFEAITHFGIVKVFLVPVPPKKGTK
jgi:hypothetical protein